MRGFKGVFGGIKRNLSLWIGVFLCAFLLGGCFLVRFFSKNFNYNRYRITKVVMGGHAFDFKDIILEAQELNPDQDTNAPNTPTADMTLPQKPPAPTPSPAQSPKSKLDLLKAELDAKIKDLNAQSLPPDNSMIKTDMKQLQSDIARNHIKKLPPNVLNSPMGRVEFDQKQLRAYGLIYCNKYFISYAFRDDDHLRIEDKGISRRVCKNEKLMAFELAFYENLQGLFTITRGKTTLVLDNQKMQIYLQH
ncbi:META domain-containing protein [Helicobacter cynogastricus]|uniref:META domain-containing protein n=1 Tax=Helicobacter cynogastricus TaxID=329937 RepID=UPI000CF0341D|nr:META domain-containing protein [Helicobacter cynogastricus]